MKARTLKNKNNLVVSATDFSKNAGYAVEHAVGIANMFGYNIHLLYIKTKKTKLSELEIEEKLTSIAEDIKKDNKDIKVQFAIRGGNPIHSIGEYAEEVKANYLTIGTRGKTGVEYVPGNYSAKIIENSPIPTIVVQKRHFDTGYKNIIIPVDEGLETRQKVKWTLLFGKKWNSTVHILAKHTSDSYYSRKIKTNVMQIKKIFDQNRLHYTIHFSNDKKTNFGRQIVEYAISKKGDLIIIMTDFVTLSPGMFSGGLFGGRVEDIEKLIKAASQIPYMCINPQDLEKKRGILSLFSASGG